ncbi:MAG: hypothetical protein Q6365_016450 [Candidatus Sigynarchaeota archaeon]
MEHEGTSRHTAMNRVIGKIIDIPASLLEKAIVGTMRRYARRGRRSKH